MESPESIERGADPRAAAPDPAPLHTPARPKRPTAVTVVSVIAAVAALAFALTGGLAVAALWECGVLGSGSLQPALCGDPPVQVDPPAVVAGAIHALVTALGIVLILYGFIRLRPWAWVALMTWCGFVLARDLLRYYLVATERPMLYLGLFFSALVVLALNQEDVQKAFGIQRDAHDLVPLHGAENPGDHV